MKKILLILTLLFSVVAGAMAQNDAIYVYRNDGEFNAFLKSDVDSMRYSHLDADSIYHNDWQMQEVFTADSVYRIPLTAIDSVSFVTPEPVYKQDVKVISDEWMDYVISYTDSTILFSSSIPQRLLPKVGHVVAVKAGNVTFPDGFAGKMEGVQNVDQNIQASFSPVQLQDVYSLLVSVGSAESYNSDDDMQDSRQRIWGYGNDVNIKLPHELGFEVKTDNASFSGKFIDPSLQVDYIVCIDEANLKNFVQFKYRFDSDGKFTTTLKKEGESLIDAAKWSPSLRFAPFGVPCSLRVGAFIKTESSIELNSEFPFHFNNYGGFEFDESYGFKYDMLHYGMRKLPSKATFKWKEPEWSLSLNGSLYTGFALEFGIGLAYEKVKVVQGDVTIKTGLELSSSFNIASNEGIYASAYEALKDTKVDLAWKTEATLGYCAFLCSKRQELPFSLSFVHMKRSTPLLPEVSSPTWKYLGTGHGTLGADVSNDTFMPCQLGWALYDGDKLVRKDYISETYWFNDRWSLDGLQYTYRDLPSSFSYKAYPLIKLLRMEIRVPESVDMRSGIPAHVTDFKVTKSYHKDGAYTNDGRSYDYKFDAATTVELDPKVVRDLNGDGKISIADLVGVEDWGYAYEDPDGKVTHISQKGNSSPYTDTRYAYYRNSASSSVRLYGYVRYSSDGEYFYDLPQDFPLVHIETVPTCSINLSNFKVTNSKYKEKGFTYNGETFDYRFDSSLTARLYTDIPSKLQKWGYVYEDISGNKTEIQLAGTEQTCTNSYFRNSACSVVRMYGIAYFDGIEQPYISEVYEFPLYHNIAVAYTGECKETSTKTATVMCSFENIPQTATCGVEYSCDDSWQRQATGSQESQQSITLNGLMSGTKYYYRAYIDDDGQMYYGGEKEFTTEYEIPDITGTWSCNIYKDDGSILNSLNITLTSDGKATQVGSDRIPENTTGGWSVSVDGKVGVNFSWDGVRWTWFGEQFSGQLNSLTNPSQIEGTVWRGYATEITEGGSSNRFVMTR